MAQCFLPSCSFPFLLYLPKQNGRRPGQQIKHNPRKLCSWSLLEKCIGLKLGSFPQNFGVSPCFSEKAVKAKWPASTSTKPPTHIISIFYYSFTSPKRKGTRNNKKRLHIEHQFPSCMANHFQIICTQVQTKRLVAVVNTKSKEEYSVWKEKNQ